MKEALIKFKVEVSLLRPWFVKGDKNGGIVVILVRKQAQPRLDQSHEKTGLSRI
jgi:hypothetical protein